MKLDSQNNLQIVTDAFGAKGPDLGQYTFSQNEYFLPRDVGI